ncbi:Wzz/FepE/Etk N-terminal domain-containing protein [Clostridium aestuarii]|uniref:Wzz/FepE/Etk N-terminal domain-containing protein n=1 Tax=Clostridium aestuarii TaxID=338193 RepID=A0ABT4D167_9CLOT|nr:Wzz/FepE/Etk N-terminal domain-containing protein [Clostridium aestuarii]MCY6484372.1 Wzz/FepE/Etk N-terminal domain-containing protein [Clostridium aestuarii]
MEEEITLDLRELFQILRKRLKLIVGITLITTIAAAIISFFVLTPVYEAKLSVFIGKTAEVQDQKVTYNSSDVVMYQKLVKSYVRIAKTHEVAENVIKKLNLNMTSKELLDNLKVIPQADTQIIDIKIQDKEPEEAKKIVEAVTTAFMEKAPKIIPNGHVQIVDKAQLPENPVKPKKVLNIAIAFFLGLMVSVGIAFILEYMDNTIKTQNDIEKYLEIPVLGIIPEHEAE